ncbi:developmentally regulated GTP-binding protein [Sanghuangporus baumii]|uniref:Developmentally regulated GTP-binding protein n=1 Tax=Sanghuangporus baumii TaxID=108892 RepID=A0A9Q5N9A0_SANBA|nr:developmentally regulated GTP-binding protein [Sanghuangporus baumii]
MARTQKNKATEYHLGLLKAKLARYRAELLEPTSKSGGAGTGFEVQKSGDARVALIGFPSVGKSTLLNKMTHTASEAAAYEFTTLTAIPGVLEYAGARIQLLDLPGIVEGASQGRGRGRQVVAVAKTADLIIMMLDATKSLEQRRLLEIELDAVGIRLNKRKPDVIVKRKTTGGVGQFILRLLIFFTFLAQMTMDVIADKIHNCDVMIREDISTDEFIDVLIGTRKYIPCLYVYNKIDSISLEQVDKLAREDHTVVISCEMDLNLDYLLERLWEYLDLVKVYTKKRGAHPDLTDPICLRKGATIEDVCHGIHRSLAANFRYALVWGRSSKFSPHAQKVGLNHVVADDDVVSTVASSLNLEFIFLGTGTSSSLPQIKCLTTSPSDPQCKACTSALTPEGRKNARRNTSALFRMKGKDGNPVTVVIDVGKTFLASALELFPKYGLRRIDAVLITHAHADAMNGLDDLRGWTLHGNIQPYIDIYVSQATYTEIGRAFPYLLSKEFASGGGDVPEFRWHIIEDRQTFEILDTGIHVTPFSVYHGKVFKQCPPPSAALPTPNYTSPPTPVSGRTSPLPSAFSAPVRIHTSELEKPYLCMGFKIEDAVIYISDVSLIPEDVWEFLLAPAHVDERNRIPMLVLDCLRIVPHTSHLGLKQAVDVVRKLKARRSYLVGFTHDMTHEEYAEVLRSLEGEQDLSNVTPEVRHAIKLIKGDEKQWVRPAFDGLRIFISPDGLVAEDCNYDSWPIVSFAFLLRYPNPYASHVVSCDVISRNVTPEGTLSTTRLILKRGALPKWAPKGIINRAESWVVEQSEVDLFGRVVRCQTRNLDHVKALQVHEFVELREADNGGTLQTTQAQFISRFGWGLTKRIENHGLAKFKANIQRSREGVSSVLRMLRESRFRPLTMGPDGHFTTSFHPGSTSESWPRTYNAAGAAEGDQNREPLGSSDSKSRSSLKTRINKGT